MLRGLALKFNSTRSLFATTVIAPALASTMIVATGCSPKQAAAPSTAPIVLKVETRSIASPSPAAARLESLKRGVPAKQIRKSDGAHSGFVSTTSPVVSSQVTFDKKSILNRVFLYGNDLQYSSIGEDDGMLLQSLSIGHITTRFQIIGNRLQLVSEEKYRFESDINIPLSLIHEWTIVAQTADNITVEISKASPTLTSALDESKTVRSTWVRSVEFIQQGNYLLLESTVETSDGSVTEFMESIFPRDTFIANAPKPLLADPSREPLASRFGFLANGVWLTFPDGRVETAVAQRFPVTATSTIDWYVTPNIPAEYVQSVKDGVEGWNRYSRKMWGRDFIKFKGVLPAGIKIGDPRYNVINWDSVVDASAAYESQASDPETGIQSHSLIYLPYAWVTIGKEFWEKGENTSGRTAALKSVLDKAQYLGRKVDVSCFNEAEMVITPAMANDPDLMAKELLKGVLFHEVGHALGLSHNFKGSLNYNPDQPGSLFSSSVMDYNQYQIEGGAFDGPGLATGPLLEYDRQIISALYNGAKDISATDAVVPHCKDGNADSKKGGVDPFCIRYDAGQDPTEQLIRTLKLIEEPTSTLGKTTSLASAVDRTVARALGDPANVKSATDLEEVEDNLRSQVLAVNQFYLTAGAQGLNFMMSTNLRMLYTFKPGSLPQGADAVAIRDRVAKTMATLMDMDGFSAATHKAVDKSGDAAAQWLKQTPWYALAAQDVKTQKEDSVRGAAAKVLSSVETSALARIRARALASLTRVPTAPYFLSSSVDYEAQALSWLERALSGVTATGKPYTTAERMAAATTLKSFADVPESYDIKAHAKLQVAKDVKAAKTAEERESLRALLALL